MGGRSPSSFKIDFGTAIAVDGTGDAYVTGSTNAGGGSCYGPPDLEPYCFGAFVRKLNPTGTTLVYDAFLRGTRSGGGNGIALDASGNAYVTGQTTATDFPTTPGAVQQTLSGSQDGFVSKLDSAGSLVYSSYLGGSGTDAGNGIAVDPAGNAWVTGTTGSANFPTTADAFRRTFGGATDAFVAKIASGPPACAIQALLPGPPVQLQVLVHADRGLASLLVPQASNTSIALPTFTPGSTGTFLVTATKVDQSARSTFTLHLTDQTGSSTDCDPALVTVGRAPGDSPVQVIHHVATTESHVTIANGAPGVNSVRLLVNGRSFEATDLHDGETRSLDVSSAMRQGADTTILVIAHGPRASSAAVLVSDS